MIISLQFYSQNSNLSNLVQNYSTNYVEKERYRRVANKVDDYEWILKNIYKVDGIDTMRIHWCGR